MDARVLVPVGDVDVGLSPDRQSADAQVCQLTKAGRKKVFREVASVIGAAIVPHPVTDAI